MSLSFLTSLQNMAATKIVTRLWNGADAVALIAECDNYYYRGTCWQEIEKRVHVKISLLRLPTHLKEKLSSFVAPMGDEIRRWKETHVDDFGIKNVPREFCWTSRGTLDKKGTAEAFVRDPTLPEGERYAMACLYCLEWDDAVPFLWRESYPLSDFQAFWTYDRTGDETALDRAIGSDPSRTPYQRAFHFAFEWYNLVATEYYFHKLSPGEREESLSDVEVHHSYLRDFDYFRFLLLHMDEGQRSKLLQSHGGTVLECSLEWPWQQFFLDGARLVRDTLRRDQYYSLLSEIVHKIEEEYHDYCYHELFSRFWMQIPPNHKKELILQYGAFMFNYFLPFIGEKNALLMLKDLSPEEREELLLGDRGIYACLGLAREHQWDLLEFFIRECLSSYDKMIHFKEACRKIKAIYGSAFFEWIDELIEKRGREEKDCPVPHKISPDLSADHT